MSKIDIEAKENSPIFLLKTKSTPNDGYEEHFSAVKNGVVFEPIFVPVLEHKFEQQGLDVVRGLLQKKSIGRNIGAKYGGLIFTSQRAVEAFAQLVQEGAGDENWPYLQDIPIYTVGPATSRALRSIPQIPPLSIFGSEMGNGEALAAYMLDHYSEWYRDLEIKPPLLFLVGKQRRDVIPKVLMSPSLSEHRRIQVDELVVYGTGVMKSFEEDFSQLLLETERRDLRWVVVFSPTGCSAMLRALDLLDSETGLVRSENQLRNRSSTKTYVATIGPTTRDYLRNSFGFEPDVCAETPSPDGVEEAIRAFLASKC